MDSQCAVLEPGLSDPNQLIAEMFHVNSLEAPCNLSALCPGDDKSIYSCGCVGLRKAIISSVVLVAIIHVIQ